MAATISERARLVEVTAYAEVREALRASDRLAVVIDDASAPVRGGTVLRIDGEAHTKRRRVLNQLVLRDGHTLLREETLAPAMERNLATLRFDGGVARFDLVELCNRTLVEVVAALIGFDVTGRLEELVRLQSAFEEFARLRTQLGSAAPPNPDGVEGLRRAAARATKAKQELVERFYLPALAERTASSAPVRDFISLVAAHADPAFDADPDLPVRHAIIDMLHAGVGTSVGAIVQTVDELERYFVERPEERALATDPEFLRGAVHETLRLHAANPAEVRCAVVDVTLSAGTRVGAGQYAALRTGIANRDPSVFGPDADRFDPRRVVPPATYPYGLAFGSGPHMCYGLPLALGNDTVDGNLVRFVGRLFAAGIRKDPEQKARYREGIAHADLKGFETYPALMQR